MNVFKVLDLSTGHLPRMRMDGESPANLGTIEGLLAFPTPFGWMMPIIDDVEDHYADFDVPPEIMFIINYVKRLNSLGNQIDYVWFDWDSQILDDLPEYAW